MANKKVPAKNKLEQDSLFKATIDNADNEVQLKDKKETNNIVTNKTNKITKDKLTF